MCCGIATVAGASHSPTGGTLNLFDAGNREHFKLLQTLTGRSVCVSAEAVSLCSGWVGYSGDGEGAERQRMSGRGREALGCHRCQSRRMRTVCFNGFLGTDVLLG